MTIKLTPGTAIIAGVLVLALMMVPQIVDYVSGGRIGVPHAQEGGGGQGHRGQGSPGDMGGGGASRRGGAGVGSSQTGSGQSGPSSESEAKGPIYMGGSQSRQPGEATRGGKPVWAREGIPEGVELGRLSVARSPDQVINKALAEALANFDPALSAALYSMDAQSFAEYVKANYETVTRIDSPLENLSLYKDILSDGQTQLPNVNPASVIDLAAIFLGSASDKTIPVTRDTAIAVDTIMGLPQMTDAQIDLLAAKAEIVRQAIHEAHG